MRFPYRFTDFEQPPEPAEEPTTGVSRRWLRWLIAAAVLIAAVAGSVWGFRRIGQWLVVQDELEPAQAIVVLSGRLPDRARQAAELYRQGFAAQVWVTRPVSAAEELQGLGISFVGEEFYNEKVLMALGVPADAIRVIDKPIVNTEEEVVEIAAELRREEAEKVIVVTSKPHTRRVRAIWKRLVGESPRLIVRYASTDAYDGGHWWRHTRDALDVVRELLGLANAWTGFPVRPADQRGISAERRNLWVGVCQPAPRGTVGLVTAVAVEHHPPAVKDTTRAGKDSERKAKRQAAFGASMLQRALGLPAGTLALLRRSAPPVRICVEGEQNDHSYAAGHLCGGAGAVRRILLAFTAGRGSGGTHFRAGA